MGTGLICIAAFIVIIIVIDMYADHKQDQRTQDKIEQALKLRGENHEDQDKN